MCRRSTCIFHHTKSGLGAKLTVVTSLQSLQPAPWLPARLPCMRATPRPAAAAVVAVCSSDQLLLWGWRVPFLVVIVTVALVGHAKKRTLCLLLHPCVPRGKGLHVLCAVAVPHKTTFWLLVGGVLQPAAHAMHSGPTAFLPF